MRRTMRKLFASCLCALAAVGLTALSPRDARAQVAGLNMGAPVWKGVVAKDALDASLATGATQIRVNFRLDDWSSPDDTTRHGGKTFFEAYDAIVDAITSQGREVYGLVSDELVAGEVPGSQAFEDAYARNVAMVIERYKDRVRVWETINEPNDYAGGSSARFPAGAFAEAHARVYDEVKGKHPGDACWDVTLVTGPLFSFDGTTAADYLDRTIAAGRAGGTWKVLRDTLGHDPVDGVGYHLYVAQGSDSPISDVGAVANRNLDAVRGVLARAGLGDRKVWISEMGYAVPAVDEPGQADRLDASFDALGARNDVAALHWFTIADFGGEGWGLYKGGFGAADRRPVYDRFVGKARAFAPALAAKLEIEPPAKAAPGARIVVKVRATNLGTAAWSDADGFRLGAASGCPSAWAVNEATWSPDPKDGYASSATDARRFLAQGASVAQGASMTFEVPVTLGREPGKQRFAARMVKEGAAWFGATVSADLEVAADGVGPASSDGPGASAPPGSSGGPSGTRADDGGAGCGCREAPRGDAEGAAKGALFGLALVGAAVRLRRRRAGR